MLKDGWTHKHKTLTLLLLAIAAPVISALMLSASRPYFGTISDLPQYCAASRMIVTGQASKVYNLGELSTTEHILFPEMGKRIVGLYLPPPGLPWLTPLGLLRPQTVRAVWLPVLLLCLLGSIMLLNRAFALTSTTILWLWVIISVSGPAYEALRLGQVIPFLVLGFSLALWAIKFKRPYLAGIALSVFTLKPQLILPFAMMLLGARRYKVLSSLAVCVLLFSALSWLMVGNEGYAAYARLLTHSLYNTAGMQPELNPTLRGQLLRLPFLSSALATAISAAVLVIVSGWLVTVGHRLATRSSWLEDGLRVAIPLGLITALHCHDYDLLMLMPVIAASLASKSSTVPSRSLITAVLVCATPFMMPIYIWIHYDYLLKSGVVNPLFLALLCVTFILGTAFLRKEEQTTVS